MIEIKKNYIHKVEECSESFATAYEEQNELYDKFNHIFETFYKKDIKAIFDRRFKSGLGTAAFYEADNKWYLEYSLVHDCNISQKTNELLIKDFKQLDYTLDILNYAGEVCVYRVSKELVGLHYDMPKKHDVSLLGISSCAEDSIPLDGINISLEDYIGGVNHLLYDKNCKVSIFGKSWYHLYEGKICCISPVIVEYLSDSRVEYSLSYHDMNLILNPHGYDVGVECNGYTYLVGEIPSTSYYTTNYNII